MKQFCLLHVTKGNHFKDNNFIRGMTKINYLLLLLLFIFQLFFRNIALAKMWFETILLRVYLESAYFIEIKNILLKILWINEMLVEIVQKNTVKPINSSKNKLNSNIS